MNKGISSNFGLSHLAGSSDTNVSAGGGALIAVSTVVSVGRGVACSTDEGGCPCDYCSIISIHCVICVIWATICCVKASNHSGGLLLPWPLAFWPSVYIGLFIVISINNYPVRVSRSLHCVAGAVRSLRSFIAFIHCVHLLRSFVAFVCCVHSLR